MNAVPKPHSLRQGQRSWTDAQRAQQAAKLRARQIWLKSTGPTTPEGKAASSRNARSANYHDNQEIKHINAYLRTQNHYRKLLSFFSKHAETLPLHVQNHININLDYFENELIDLERKMFGGFRFWQVIEMNKWRNHGNILPFHRL